MDKSLQNNTLNIIRISDAADIFGCSRVTIWRMENRGDLPPRQKFNKRCVGWLESDLKDFLESRPLANPQNDTKTDGGK